MSSSAAENSKSPPSISDKTVRSPSLIASASLSLTIPVAASIAAWARDPAMSCAASRLSNEIEALIASMIASGPAAKRPPHIWFEVVSVIFCGPLEGNHETSSRDRPLYGPRPRCKCRGGRYRRARGTARGRHEEAHVPLCPRARPAGGIRARRRLDRDARRLPGQACRAQFLGHVVRALPGGDADAVQPAGADG